MELRLEIPDGLAEALGREPARGALEAIVAELLFRGDVSMGYASEVLRRPIVDVIGWYTDLGHTYPDYPAEELGKELDFWRDRDRGPS
ncbi:MAG: hypothetical protein WAM30_14495 [Candidatus Dormiibacterota bacterium]